VASRQLENRPHRTPVLRKVGAGLILLAIAALAIQFVIHLIVGVIIVCVVVIAAVAVLWALSTIL
jgi:protein-S-isoprenylcysteine O-methyltransferase Ste14